VRSNPARTLGGAGADAARARVSYPGARRHGCAAETAVRGSANITTGDFGGNLELWTHTDDDDVVAAIVAFLVDLIGSPSV